MERWQRESGKTASCSVSLILDPTVDTCSCSCLERSLFVPGKVSKKHSTLHATLRHFARGCTSNRAGRIATSTATGWGARST